MGEPGKFAPLESPSMKLRIFRDYFSLCKPKVIAVMLVTAWVGMLLASHRVLPWSLFIFATLGIALSGASAAVINHLIDASIDSKMSRTFRRPIASGRIKPKNAIVFAIVLAVLGLSLLIFLVNTLTALLTFFTVLCYAFLYTLFLKRATPQNIVIGGTAGAMPPLLGWASVSNDISPYALLLVLIIFTWTPPHFWALAIYRKNDYQKVNIPMLPVTHGILFTKISVILYTILLILTTILPYVTGMSGLIYLFAAIILGMGFLFQSYRLFKSSYPETALKTFSFSVLYLLLLFAALLIDHYVRIG